jgi:hypothetical protein
MTVFCELFYFSQCSLLVFQNAERSTVLYDIKVLCWAVYFVCLCYMKAQRDVENKIS